MKKNKLNSKNPKYKSGRGYNDKEDENAKEKQKPQQRKNPKLPNQATTRRL